MKKLKPEEIQRFAESKDPGVEASSIAGQEKELEAYRQLMDLLDEGPDIGLRYDFTATLARRINAAADKRISGKWYFFSAVLMCMAFGMSYLLILIYDFRAAHQFIEFIIHYKWILMFVLVVFLSVQYLDKRLKPQPFYLLILFTGFLPARVHGQQTAQTFTRQTGYLLSLPDGYTTDKTKKWPLLLFLHGSGECGTDIEKVKVNGPPKLVAAGKHFPFIIVSPQAEDADIGWEPEDLHHLLVYIKQTYRVDDTRIYLTGLSMGGFGAWALAIKHPEEFAAMIPICGGGDSAEAWKLRHIAIWCFHGALDNVVPVERDEQMVTAAKRYNPSVKFTVYPDAQHNSWERTYNNDSVFDWLLSQTKFAFKEVAVGQQLLKAYAGTFVGNQGDTVRLSIDDKGLQAKTPNGSTVLKPSADTVFFVDQHAQVEIQFIRDLYGQCNSFIVFEQTKSVYRRIK